MMVLMSLWTYDDRDENDTYLRFALVFGVMGPVGQGCEKGQGFHMGVDMLR